MIYILSENKDSSTNRIVQILRQKNAPVVRLNQEDDVTKFILNINIESVEIETSEKTIIINKRDLIWYRKGRMIFRIPFSTNKITPYIQEYINKEYGYISEYISRNFNFIGSYEKEIRCNKLINLSVASSLGLNIPLSWVVNTKLELQKILKSGIRFITKPLNNGHLFVSEESFTWSSTGTRRIDSSDIDNLDETFTSTLVQEYIDKDIEIRCFIFNELIYSVAIFSQLDDKTKIDFRNYNFDNFNRVQQIKLPEHIKSSLFKLMKILNYKTASLDLILTPSGKYYFLELNPTGQFGWISDFTDCDIENGISNELIKIHERL